MASPLSFSVQSPLGGICIEWCDFCFQRGKFYKLCFTFISAWAVSSWENSFLLGKNGCEALAKTKGRFYCKENCLLLLPKKAKHMRQNHKYFPVCLYTWWKEAWKEGESREGREGKVRERKDERERNTGSGNPKKGYQSHPQHCYFVAVVWPWSCSLTLWASVSQVAGWLWTGKKTYI